MEYQRMSEHNHSQYEDEPHATVKTKHNLSGKPALYTESLMEIFDFSESTLNTNRGNFATNQQRQFLQADLKNDADAMWLLLTILLGTSIVVGLIMRMQGIPMEYLVMGAGVLIVPMLWLGYRQQMGARKDLDNFHVRSVQGKAEVYWVGRGTYLRARLRVHDQWFEIGIQQAHALEEYDLSQMRVYYAENSRTLLSAEVLPDYTTNKLKLDEEQETDIIVEAEEQYNQQQR
jgi:hypothetical protein